MIRDQNIRLVYVNSMIGGEKSHKREKMGKGRENELTSIARDI